MRGRHWGIMALLALTWTDEAGAGLITYEVQATLSGSLNGVAFTDALVTITASGDPAATLYNPTDSQYHNLALSTSVTIAGFATVSFTDKIEVVDAQGITPPVFRIYDVTAAHSVLGVADSFFSTYDLQSLFGPITSTQTHDFGNAYATTGGALILTGNAPGNQATAFAIPEPSSIVLASMAGLFALGISRKRCRTAATRS